MKTRPAVQGAAERRLILLSASTGARREMMRNDAQRLLGDVHWPRLAATLHQRRLLALLGPRISDLAGERADAGFRTATERAGEAARRHGRFMDLLTGRLTVALSDAGIRCSVLKGAALEHAIYAQHGKRVASDVDLLVAAEELQAAVAAVRGLGYRTPADPLEGDGLPRLHLALMHEHKRLPPVELHWRIHWYERAFARERLLAPRAEEQDRWRPALADQLASLLLFYARDGFIDLRLAADLAAWWDRYGQTLERGAFARLLGAYPALELVLCSAVTVAEQIVGLPATQILGGAHKLPPRGRAAARLANPNPRGSASQRYAEAGMIDGLLSPPGELRALLRRHLLLPRAVLDHRAQRPPEQRTRSTVIYSARLALRAGVLARYALGAAHLLRGPETLRP